MCFLDHSLNPEIECFLKDLQEVCAMDIRYSAHELLVQPQINHERLRIQWCREALVWGINSCEESMNIAILARLDVIEPIVDL